MEFEVYVSTDIYDRGRFREVRLELSGSFDSYGTSEQLTFSQWVDVGAEFSSLIEVPALLRPSAGRLSPPSSSCGRECPAGKE